MNCKYSHQGDEIHGRHYLYCNINKEVCPFVRYCPTVRDIINLDNIDKSCKIYIEQEENIGYSTKTPDKVLMSNGSKLWVKNKAIDQVFIVENPYDYVPTFVKLLQDENGEYYI